MASPAVNVLRYSALGAGVLYGFLHQRTLYSAAEKYKLTSEYAHKQAIIDEAKRQWARKQERAALMASRDTDVITDPMDSKFDLEKFINYKMSEQGSH